MLNQKSLISSVPKNIPGACSLVTAEQKYALSEKYYFSITMEIIALAGISISVSFALQNSSVIL